MYEFSCYHLIFKIHSKMKTPEANPVADYKPLRNSTKKISDKHILQNWNFTKTFGIVFATACRLMKTNYSLKK